MKVAKGPRTKRHVRVAEDVPEPSHAKLGGKDSAVGSFKNKMKTNLAKQAPQEPEIEEIEHLSDTGTDPSQATSTSSGSSDVLAQRLYERVSRISVCDRTGRLLDQEEVVRGLLSSMSNAIRSLAPIAIVLMDSTCTIVDMNPKAEEVFGRQAHDSVGQNVKCLMPHEIGSKHDGIIASYLQRYEDKRRPPKSSIVNASQPREVLAVRMVEGKAKTFPAEISVKGIPHPGGKHIPPLFFLAYIDDVTERLKLREAIEVNSFIREKGDTPLIVMSDYGKILEFNQAAADLFRYNRKFIVNQNIKKLMPPEIAAVHDGKLQQHRDRVSSGMIHTSPVVGKPRELTGYRPKFDAEGFEEFHLELRVESFSGGRILVAFVKDISKRSNTEMNGQSLEESFPLHTHERLMRGEPVWDEMPNVSILVADIVGFTSQVEEMEPEDVFSHVNQVVGAFDEMGYSMEKLKTLGDGYMAYFTSADDAIFTALRMHEFCIENQISIRISIHTGDVVGGIVGSSRRTFDMWGPTLNVARKLEEQGVVGQLQISGETYDNIEDEDLRRIFVGHSCNIKGHGVIGTYLTHLPADGSFPDDIMAMLADRDVEAQHHQASMNAGK